MSTRPTPVLEIAAFTVRAPDAFSEIQHRTHSALATLPGYRASLRLRGMTDGLFADVVAWESLAAAQEASTVAHKDPRFVELMTNIEGLKEYAHYRLHEDPVPLLAELRRAPVVEVASYAVRDVAVHVEVHARVHDALRAAAGHRGGAHAQQAHPPPRLGHPAPAHLRD